ncbi:MAG: enoyl-CoA hydratase-related protein [Acidimicrobiales bacterium]
MDGTHAHEYRAVFAHLEADSTVRAVVVTGEGRAFCAGADTAALEGHAEAGAYDAGTPAEIATPGHGVRSSLDRFAWHYGLRFPVVAAIKRAGGRGRARPGVLPRPALRRLGRLTTSAPRLGLPAEYGLSWVLPRLVGIGHAADLLLSSRVILGDEAERIGLVNRSLSTGEVLPTAIEWARRVATEVAPSSVAMAKAQLYADLHRDVGTAVATSERLLDVAVAGPDYREGVRAWLEDRPPTFRDLRPGPGPRV